MNAKPLISVIMPCFNAAKHIEAGTVSVFEQSYRNLELIAVNDGSTDGTLAQLRSIKEPRLKIIDQTNTGVCEARNQGILAAQGEFIAFLDADDTWDSTCLDKLYRALAEAPSAVLAYCGWQNIGLPGGQGLPYVPPDLEAGDKLTALFTNCCWPIHACLTKREAILSAGLFDRRLITSEDYLLWLKIAGQRTIVRVPEVLAFYHFHGGAQATGNKAKTALNHWQAQQLFIEENREIAQKLGLERCRRIMRHELMQRGMECYWKRDLAAARAIFRKVMRQGYGSLKDWKVMLPSLLPYSVHRQLISLRD